MLVVALVHSRLDYGNAVLVGLHHRPQSALKCGGTSDLSPGIHHRIADVLNSPRWLRFAERIMYMNQVAVSHDIALRCLGPLIHVDDMCR